MEAIYARLRQNRCFTRAALLLVIAWTNSDAYQMADPPVFKQTTLPLVSRGRSRLNCLESAQSRVKAVQDLACGSERAKP